MEIKTANPYTEPPAPEQPAPVPETPAPSDHEAGEGGRVRRLQGVKLAVIASAVAALTAVAFMLPLRPRVSESEKRELAAFPAFSKEALFSGSYFSDITAWFADTVPFRETLMDVNARVRHVLGVDRAQTGFNEGVTGDEIPDVPDDLPSQLPVDITEPSPTLPSENDPSNVPFVPSQTEPTEPVTDPPPPEETLTKATQKLSNILIYGNAGFEYYNFVQSTAEQYAAAVNRAAALFAGKATVYDMIIPTSTDILLPQEVRDSISASDQRKAIRYMESLLDPSVKRVSIYDTLAAHSGEYIYFRTDHHWTGLGAYYAYEQFCAVKGVRAVLRSECDHCVFQPFLGSFYNDSGHSPVLGDTPDYVETFMPQVNSEIRIIDSKGNTLRGGVIFDESVASPSFKYGAFIWGDNPWSVIENKSMASGESCLLIKESFGNALAPLLTYNYKYVYILDYRYGYSTAAKLVDAYGITDVIFCNNISMTRASSLVSQLNKSVG